MVLTHSTLNSMMKYVLLWLLGIICRKRRRFQRLKSILKCDFKKYSSSPSYNGYNVCSKPTGCGLYFSYTTYKRERLSFAVFSFAMTTFTSSRSPLINLFIIYLKYSILTHDVPPRHAYPSHSHE